MIKINSKNCKDCAYFLNCQEKHNQGSPYCEKYPEAMGYCELWNGPLQNFEPCTGWVPTNKS